MSATVWKYELEVTDEQVVMMPAYATVLTVHVQKGQPCVWVKADSQATALVERRFFIHGTGHPVNSRAGRYVGTFQLDGGALVFHVFEEFGISDLMKSVFP